MRRLKPSRPSPAMVVALIALAVALGGSATAATVAIRNSSQVASGSINSGDLANGRAVGLADLTASARRALTPIPGPAGEPGTRGEAGPGGARGERGLQGEDGADGSAIAFAYVRADGTLDTANSKGVNGSSTPSTGIYCLDLDPLAKNGQVALDFAGIATGAENGFVTLPINVAGKNTIDGNCVFPDTDAMVAVFDPFNGFVPGPFWVSFN